MSTSTKAVFGMILSAVLACSGNPPGEPARDDRVISKETMTERGFRNAHEAVAALHPNWLLTKGVDSYKSPGKVLVYYDNARMGGVEELRHIAVNSITFIRYYNGTEASARWGLDHGQGVIFVSSQAE